MRDRLGARVTRAAAVGLAILLAGAPAMAQPGPPAFSAPPTQAQLRSLIFVPGPENPVAASMPAFERVAIKSSDGVVLEAWWKPAAAGKKTFLVFSGNGGGPSHQQALLTQIAEQGDGFLAVAYRGYERSTGAPTEAGLHDDARAAYDWLAGKVGPKDIVICGFSLGTSVAVKLATERPAAGLILMAPMTSIEDVGRLMFPALKGLSLEDSFRSSDWIGQVKMPILVIHGDADRTVPFAMGKALFDLAPQPKTFVAIAGSGHDDLVANGAAKAFWPFVAALP